MYNLGAGTIYVAKSARSIYHNTTRSASDTEHY